MPRSQHFKTLCTMITVLNLRFRPDIAKIIFLMLISASVLYFVVVTQLDVDSNEKTLQPSEGLRTRKTNFTMERKPFRIMSGAMHYFRIPPMYWQDRMGKLKAMGLNTLETYVPWNLHEPEPGHFDFVDSLDLRSFIYTAQALGLYVILRPGPYICTEWDLGGLPSWLLRDKKMKLRTTYSPFMDAVDRYLKRLSEEVEKLQYSFGGPVIAIQIENEYGTFGTDDNYMKTLKEKFDKYGLKEFPFVCDNEQGIGKYKLDGVLQTVNFQTDLSLFNTLSTLQPDAPLFVTEFWIGWFDHWGEKHHKVKTEVISKILTKMMKMGASFNFYMFHGGTNFGFLNGANADRNGSHYKADTTSYDYDAPVSELGDLTPKYHALKKVIMENLPKGSIPDDLPLVQDKVPRVSYGDIQLTAYMTLEDILPLVQNKFKTTDVMPMEEFPINNNAGQSYGYVLYRSFIPKSGGKLAIHNARDHTMVLLGGKLIKSWRFGGNLLEVSLPKQKENDVKLDILVENCGRVNYERSLDTQRKGILGHVALEGARVTNWEVYPLEFKHDFVSSLLKSKNWRSGEPELKQGPKVYKGNLHVHHVPRDTLLDVTGWTKGSLFVREENTGRYWKEGPQRTLYVPASLLQMGNNNLLIFEQHEAPKKLTLSSVTEPVFTATEYFEI